MTEFVSPCVSNIEKEPTAPKESSGVPSGFVLKLYQMVNGAPDEVITWTDSGEAFRISDLSRLENETLPTYFRHRRFQSLVRQLNFYNFRKVNRERNFWVYKHPLFHRERPEDLHLLRRRTCPGVDGRKTKPEVDVSNLDTEKRSPVTISGEDSEIPSDSDAGSSMPIQPKKRKYTKRKVPETTLSMADERTALKVANSSIFPTYIRDDAEYMKKHKVNTPPEGMKQWLSASDKYLKGPSHLVTPSMDITKEKADQVDFRKQSLLVSRVAKQLEEHAKKASSSSRIWGKKKVGTTSSFTSDTMKFHALTYDDEIEIFDSAKGCVVERSAFIRDDVEDDSDDCSENFASIVSLSESDMSVETTKYVPTAPIDDTSVIEEIARKVLSPNLSNNRHSGVFKNSQLTVAIAKFCMKTDPKDPSLCDKAIQLMSVHADLAHEFCMYKIALSPNHKLPLCEQQEAFMKDIFQGKSQDIVRSFKTFVLNNLGELLLHSKSAKWDEAYLLNKCYDTWFSGVTTTA